MPTDTQPTPADQLADLLDGRIGPDDVDPEIAQLAELATAVRTHITLVPPTEAFREVLREQVVQSATAASGTATAVGTGAAAAGSGGGLSAIVAGLAATAVLASGTLTAADRAGPGDLLVGLDRGVEQLQLAVADDATDVDLLVGFAQERVLEALDVVDLAVVNDLLAQAQTLVDDAVALAVAQGRTVDEVVAPYTGALLTLVSRTDDPGVRAQVAQQLAAVGVAPDVVDRVERGETVLPDTPEPGDPAPAGGDSATDGPDDDGTADEDGADGGDGADPVDDVVDEVEDAVDDATDDLTDPVDDLTDPVDDLVDPVEDLVEDVEDDLLGD